MAVLDVGDQIPEFVLVDQDENTKTLADFAGSSLIMYFYPKAMTPG